MTMRVLGRASTAILLGGAFAATAFAADPAENEQTGNLLGWLCVLTSTIPALAVLGLFMRRNSRTLRMSETAMQEQKVHIVNAEEHMKRLESQMAQIDQKLGRVVALLEARDRSDNSPA